MHRRLFLASTAAALGTARRVPAISRFQGRLDEFITDKMRRDHIPGVTAALVRGDRIAWSNSYGFADLTRRTPMSLDTIQNIGSISKTFATTALLQMVEARKLGLDDPLSRHLPFPVENPNHPGVPITIRQLLTHRSSLRDGPAYARRYACGDPTLGLGPWLEGYFTPGGVDYDAKGNFHPFAPDGGWDYCNLAYGLVGHLVERVSGTPFEDYCRAAIWGPLGMPETSWYLAKVDQARHLVPYTYVGGGAARGPSWGGVAQGVVHPPNAAPPPPIDGFQANCPYNHPNYPDGFLRTSVRQLARYLSGYLAGGVLEGRRFLAEESVRAMLTQQRLEGRRIQGLTWYASSTPVRGEVAWGHGGSDPGINTDIRLLVKQRIGAIAFLNTNGVRPDEITEKILATA
jgi:CubicO group peptidase (beta-lactamase class C family)